MWQEARRGPRCPTVGNYADHPWISGILAVALVLKRVRADDQSTVLPGQRDFPHLRHRAEALTAAMKALSEASEQRCVENARKPNRPKFIIHEPTWGCERSYLRHYLKDCNALSSQIQGTGSVCEVSRI
jgi:hypothetical protein